MPRWNYQRKRYQTGKAKKESGEQPTEQPSPPTTQTSQADKTYKLQGEQIKLDEIIGKDIVVRQYIRHERSKYTDKPYVSVEVFYQGKAWYFHTASVSLRDQLRRNKEAMPYDAKIVKKTSANRMHYLTLGWTYPDFVDTRKRVITFNRARCVNEKEPKEIYERI